jgi:hypothetical protein
MAVEFGSCSVRTDAMTVRRLGGGGVAAALFSTMTGRGHLVARRSSPASVRRATSSMSKSPTRPARQPPGRRAQASMITSRLRSGPLGGGQRPAIWPTPRMVSVDEVPHSTASAVASSRADHQGAGPGTHLVASCAPAAVRLATTTSDPAWDNERAIEVAIFRPHHDRRIS